MAETTEGQRGNKGEAALKRQTSAVLIQTRHSGAFPIWEFVPNWDEHKRWHHTLKRQALAVVIEKRQRWRFQCPLAHLGPTSGAARHRAKIQDRLGYIGDSHHFSAPCGAALDRDRRGSPPNCLELSGTVPEKFETVSASAEQLGIQDRLGYTGDPQLRTVRSGPRHRRSRFALQTVWIEDGTHSERSESPIIGLENHRRR